MKSKEELNKRLHEVVFTYDKFSHDESIESLIKEGADPNAPDRFGRTPLNVAVTHRSIKCIKQLLANGADVNKANDGEFSLLDGGITPLWSAAMLGYVETVRLLLDHEADVNIATHDGRTPLWIAAYEGNRKCAKLLLDHEADVNISTVVGLTPLHIALQFDRIEFALLLLRYGADTNPHPPDKDEATLLAYGMDEEHIECIKLLNSRATELNNEYIASLQDNITDDSITEQSHIDNTPENDDVEAIELLGD